MNHSVSIKDRIRAQAHALGFCDIGFTNQTRASTYPKYKAWLEQGHHGNMWYLAEEKRKNLRQDIRELMPEAKSVWVVALSYHRNEPHASDVKFARYAWGQDYHLFMKDKLTALAQWTQEALGQPFTWRCFVDTAPVLERDFAAMAGVGWIGKNTMLMNKRHGSYLYLGVMATSLDLPTDAPTTDHCGTCTACMDACPTQALPKPYTLVATDCISYHTIENRHEPMPDHVQNNLNHWVAGCDICQEVCPWNNKAAVYPPTPETTPKSAVALSAQDILALDHKTHQTLFDHHALARIPLDKLQDNVRAALKNSKKTA
jgi:epoxyqueuosine reductase